MRRGNRSENERALEIDDAVERALASLGRIGADGDVAFTTDELILRAECAKRNRETILGSAHVRRGAASPSTEP